MIEYTTTTHVRVGGCSFASCLHSRRGPVVFVLEHSCVVDQHKRRGAIVLCSSCTAQWLGLPKRNGAVRSLRRPQKPAPKTCVRATNGISLFCRGTPIDTQLKIVGSSAVGRQAGRVLLQATCSSFHVVTTLLPGRRLPEQESSAEADGISGNFCDN